ncbi:hypothetical protein ALQ64_102644 [Pseudomonas cannabina]|uniref:Uncharacterized protein n=1 Tax=Pseudomonas cannabina TaxID=86840 RepID=A0A0N8R071_PSECA|nr:hypothetical protein ALO83_103931 [Pseudomonas cannabina pv. alisalensis]KPW80374.1 hypothetical protein ALO81_102371 [Pseudomonas cannabina]RMN40534.1 hypothetical protein ALQ64_102644 [Pseudomonas cannabina]RMN81645.1 hypothetical protein ALQ52_104645 [Pseudomonas cannabina pv. alisalensis]RMN85413.1 hypothetical protein ALQ53_103674 [Pseudomonas cannabina]
MQIRLRRFDSDLGLHYLKAPQINVCGVFYWAAFYISDVKGQSWDTAKVDSLANTVACIS